MPATSPTGVPELYEPTDRVMLTDPTGKNDHQGSAVPGRLREFPVAAGSITRTTSRWRSRPIPAVMRFPGRVWLASVQVLIAPELRTPAKRTLW